MIQTESSSSASSASSAIIKTSPPWAALAANTVFGMTLNDWVMFFALVYTVLQIVVLVRNEFVRRKRTQ